MTDEELRERLKAIDASVDDHRTWGIYLQWLIILCIFLVVILMFK